MLLSETEPTLPRVPGPWGLHQDGTGDGTAEPEMLPHGAAPCAPSVTQAHRPQVFLKLMTSAKDSASPFVGFDPCRRLKGMYIAPLSAYDAVQVEVLE